MGNLKAAQDALQDMPPREEEELDPVGGLVTYWLLVGYLLVFLAIRNGMGLGRMVWVLEGGCDSMVR